METLAHMSPLPLAVFESVRCLECSEVYSKPVAGGTVQKNPGCPSCGYVGWAAVSRGRGAERTRSGADPPRNPCAQSG
jgi:hypothetical protein